VPRVPGDRIDRATQFLAQQRAAHPQNPSDDWQSIDMPHSGNRAYRCVSAIGEVL